MSKNRLRHNLHFTIRHVFSTIVSEKYNQSHVKNNPRQRFPTFLCSRTLTSQYGVPPCKLYFDKKNIFQAPFSCSFNLKLLR